MKRRQKSIIYNLTASDGPLTAEQIAKRLGVSSRTIKTEMREIRQELEEMGATLIAKRNEGYSIHIHDNDKFAPFLAQLGRDSTVISNAFMDYMSSFLYIARKLVTSSKYFKIDDIADELYSSRSTLRDPIRMTADFLGSYRMITESTPGLGVRAYGLEHHARMAMAELFADHFDKKTMDYNDVEYSKWVACDETERQGIHCNLLHTLMSSNIRLLDGHFKRISLYMIIARNRHESGYRIILPNAWIKEIKQYQEYQLAEDILANLSAEISGFDLPLEDTAFLAIWLLCGRDMGGVTVTKEAFPTFAEEAEKYAAEMQECVTREHHIRLDKADGFTDGLKSAMVTILARERFELSGTKTVESFYRQQVSERPVSLEIARTMIVYLENRFDKKMADYTNMRLLSNVVFKTLLGVSYDIDKQRLLIVNTDGISFGAIMSQKLLTAFAPLIQSCTCAELYEMQEIQDDTYDAVIVNSLEHPSDYELLHGKPYVVTSDCDLAKIHNNVLVQAYKVAWYLPDEAIMHVYQDFDYISEEQFMQLISFKHCDVSERQKEQEQIFMHNEKTASYRCGQSVFLFGRTGLAETQTVEVYFLKNPGLWGGNEIRFIMYACLNWQDDLKMIKAVDNCLALLASNPDQFNLFLSDNRTAGVKILRNALKI